MFASQIDTSSKTAMIAFLEKHPRYNTMNAWNPCTSYAHNVKLRNLNLDSSMYDKAYAFIEAECPEYEDEIHSLISEFYHKTGYTAGFNGRSGGYIVLYDVDNKGNTLARSIDSDTDFDELELDALKERTDLVHQFDQLCDSIRETFIRYVNGTVIESVEVLVPQTHIVAKIIHDDTNE